MFKQCCGLHSMSCFIMCLIILEYCFYTSNLFIVCDPKYLHGLFLYPKRFLLPKVNRGKFRTPTMAFITENT